MTPNQSKFKTFLVAYRHDGAEWIVELKAASEQDARSRLGKLVYGKITGELIATVPAGLGLIAKTVSAVRNAFWSRP
jgi:hypothetical protein